MLHVLVASTPTVTQERHLSDFVNKSWQEVGLRGSLGGSTVSRLPLAQGVILESRDRVLRQAPGMEPTSMPGA